MKTELYEWYMMKILNTLLIYSFTVISNFAFAELVTPTGVGCDTESGSCFIILEKAFNTYTCENSSNNQLRMDPTKDGTLGQYSAALAAYMAGKQLQVAAVSCYEGQPTPAYLYVTD
jgi:hypothetical protein